MNIELYFDKYKMDLSEDITFPLTTTFDNLSNPTDIVSDYSKQINLPCSDHNNKVLGRFYDIDRVIASGGTTNTGIYFDATKKLPFTLKYNQTTIMEGYAKVQSVNTKVGNGPAYQVKLFGTIGLVLSELQKMSFDKRLLDDEATVKYYIPDPIEPSIKMNANTVYHSWTAPWHQYVNDWTKWCGFAPTHQGLYDDFDSKSFQKNTAGVVETFEEITNLHNGVEITDFDAMIGDGLTDRQFGEFRSYYQQPYIYIKPLFELLAEKGEELTGWKIDFDRGWFNNSNPYWTDLVRLTNKINIETESDQNPSIYQATINNQTEIVANQWSNLNLQFNNNTPSIDADKVATMGFKLRFFCNFELNPDSNDWYAKQQSTALWKTYIPIRFKAMQGAEEVWHVDYILKFPNCTLDFDGIVLDVTKDTIQASGASSYIDVNIDDLALIGNINEGYTIQASVWTNVPRYGDQGGYQRMYIRQVEPGNALVEYIKPKRTGQNLDYSTIVETDESFYPFKVLMEYVKMFGLVVDYDIPHKTLSIIDKNSFFKNYKIEDWSNKLDKTKDFILTPVTFEHKNVLFDYNDIEGRKYEDYKAKHDVNYGGTRITTSYEFDNEDTKLFEGLTPTCISSKVIHDWNRIYSLNFQKFVEKEVYIDAETDDMQPINLNGAYAFKCRNQKVDSRLRKIRITDDTPFQRATQNYMYLDVNETNNMAQFCARNEKTGGVNIDELPKLDITDESNHYGCLFVKPTEIYTYNGVEAEAENWIYPMQWKKYIEERYDIQNKKLTCYMYITPNDWNNFKFNKLIRIENQLFMVNKIYDFNPTSNETTKVDLISIQNLDAYVNGQKKWDYFETDADYTYMDTGRLDYYIKLEADDEGFDFTLYNSRDSYSVVSKPSWITMTDNDGFITCDVPLYGGSKNRVGFIVLRQVDTNKIIIIEVEQVPTYYSNIEVTTAIVTMQKSAMAVVGYTSLQEVVSITSSEDWLNVRYDSANIYMTAVNTNTTGSNRTATVTITDIYGVTKVIMVQQPKQFDFVMPDRLIVVTAGTASTAVTIDIRLESRIRRAQITRLDGTTASIVSTSFNVSNLHSIVNVSLGAMVGADGIVDITLTDTLNRQYYVTIVRSSDYD